jgi:hypothetical protein
MQSGTSSPPAGLFTPALPPCPWQELERGESDVLECDTAASCLYVNEPKVKVDLTKYTERHTFRQAHAAARAWGVCWGAGVTRCDHPRHSLHGPSAGLTTCLMTL